MTMIFIPVYNYGAAIRFICHGIIDRVQYHSTWHMLIAYSQLFKVNFSVMLARQL